MRALLTRALLGVERMSSILKFLSDNSAALTALATIIIALFTFLMWWVSRRIHQASLKRDKEMTDLYLIIMSTILVSGKTVGEADLAIRLIKEQKEKLSQLFITSIEGVRHN